MCVCCYIVSVGKQIAILDIIHSGHALDTVLWYVHSYVIVFLGACIHCHLPFHVGMMLVQTVDEYDPVERTEVQQGCFLKFLSHTLSINHSDSCDCLI